MSKNIYFYQSEKIVTIKNGVLSRSIVQSPTTATAYITHSPLGETIRLGTDNSKSTILASKAKDGHEDINYSAFGYTPKRETLLLGFNGEFLEESLDCYSLGGGHRYFSPRLMRFLSCDILSPFDLGERNAYSYCRNDPINRSDPSGNFSVIKWMKGGYSVPVIRKILDTEFTDYTKQWSITKTQKRILTRHVKKTIQIAKDGITKHDSALGLPVQAFRNHHKNRLIYYTKMKREAEAELFAINRLVQLKGKDSNKVRYHWDPPMEYFRWENSQEATSDSTSILSDISSIRENT